MNKKILTLANVQLAAATLATRLLAVMPPDFRIYGIPRGGISAALFLQVAIMEVCPTASVLLVATQQEANLVVDDLMDSGTTMAHAMSHRDPFRTDIQHFAVLFRKTKPEAGPAPYFGLQEDGWLVFPWERSEAGHDSSAEDAVIRMMQAIGEDVTREGLLDTPKRVVKAWGEWFSGYHRDPAELFKTFEDGSEGVNEMVLLTDIPVFSHCEHHITPFIGVAHVAYIPNGKIVGLSKLARVVDMFSRRLQVQERLNNQVADAIMEHLDPLGCGVVITAKHFCMATRGVGMPNVNTTTSALRGVFKDKPEVRAEFLNLVQERKA